MAIGSIHLEGRALKWFQGYEDANGDINWKKLSIDVISQLGPNFYDSPIRQLTKLKQVSTVK